jgi:hypothetical protein
VGADEPDGEGVTIAVIALESVTSDAIWVHAEPYGGEIRYGIADEYETEFEVTPETSIEPLSFGELIDLIDEARSDGTAGTTELLRDVNLDYAENAEELVDFVWVSSDFYPHLQNYYVDRANAWLEQTRSARDT